MMKCIPSGYAKMNCNCDSWPSSLPSKNVGTSLSVLPQPRIFTFVSSERRESGETGDGFSAV